MLSPHPDCRKLSFQLLVPCYCWMKLQILRWVRAYFRNEENKLHTQAWCILMKR